MSPACSCWAARWARTTTSSSGWLSQTKTLLSLAVRRSVPTLAICLGHQLLAVAEGGVVERGATGQQVGLCPVRLTPAAADDPLFGDLGDDAVVAHWNNDIVTVTPPDAVPLAHTDAGLQAFRLGPVAWGVQFHPEVTVEILRDWADADIASGALTDAVVEQRLAAVDRAEAGRERTGRLLSRAFAEVVRSRPGTGHADLGYDPADPTPTSSRF